MIIMDVKVDNLFAFKDFHINMSYPKKIVDSAIKDECLENFTNFRYKKVNIIMGANATGKTSFGKLLMCFTNYLEDGSFSRFTDVISDTSQSAKLQIDFVIQDDNLYRLLFLANPKKNEKYTDDDIQISIKSVLIGKRDNYETCVLKFENPDCVTTTYDKINVNGWSFLYPLDSVKNKTYYTIEENENYLFILEETLKTLDPSIEKVIKISEVENTYAVIWKNCRVIIQDGRILNGDVMSSGTKAGLDISYVITSLLCNMHDLYYCDELFSYVNSDVEKASLSVIIDKIVGRKQLFFTTHNSDILDMQLPKHSFTFLRKETMDGSNSIQCVYASDYLKRNTDSLKSAVENDLFCTAPALERIYKLLNLGCSEE